MRYAGVSKYEFTRPSDNRTETIYNIRKINFSKSDRYLEINGTEQIDSIAHRIYGSSADWYRLAEKNADEILALRGNTGRYRLRI